VSVPRTGEYTDEEIRKLPACPKCGLEASSLLHPFCQSDDCPVLRALGKTKMPGLLEEIVNPTKDREGEHGHDH